MPLRSSYAYLYNSRPLGPPWFTSKEEVDGHVLELLRVRRLKAALGKAARRCLREVRHHRSRRAFMARNARLVRALLVELQN